VADSVVLAFDEERGPFRLTYRRDVPQTDGSSTTLSFDDWFVQIDDKTKYLRGDAAAQESDLAAGLRVVIDAAAVDGKQVAREIKLGPAPK